MAVKNGHKIVINLLLDAMAEVNGKYEGGTTLQIAAWKGYKVVKLLLEAKADVNMRSDSGQTALHWAAGVGDVAVVKLLLEAKTDINAKDSLERTTLHIAA